MKITLRYKDAPSKNEPTKIKLTYTKESSGQSRPVKVKFKEPSSKKNPDPVKITYKEKLGCEEVRICPNQGVRKIRVQYIDSKEIKEMIKNGAEVRYTADVFLVYDPNDQGHYFRIIPSGENKSTHFWNYLMRLGKNHENHEEVS